MEWHLAGAFNGTLFLPQGLAFNYVRETPNYYSPEVHGENNDYRIDYAGAPPEDWYTILSAPSQWWTAPLE